MARKRPQTPPLPTIVIGPCKETEGADVGLDQHPSKKAAVVLDDWKIPIFKKHLDAAGFKYEEPVPFVDGTSILKVYCEWVHKLQPIIEAAQRECAEFKGKS